MSVAAVTEAIDNFAANDSVLRDNIMAQLDREIDDIEAERSKVNAALDARREKIVGRKVAISNEFEQRAIDLMAILNGKA
jgi:hypothetical protein